MNSSGEVDLESADAALPESDATETGSVATLDESPTDPGTTETLVEKSPSEILQALRHEVVGQFNNQIREVYARLMRLAETLDRIQNAKLIPHDPTVCPRNTLYEHTHYHFRYFDPETGSDVDTMETERCQGGVCELGADAESAIWLRKQMIWNRFNETKTQLEELGRDRPARLKQLSEIDEQLEVIQQSGGSLPTSAVDGADVERTLLDPSELTVPQLEQPVVAQALDQRSIEDLERERQRLIEAIDAGSFDMKLVKTSSEHTDCLAIIPKDLQEDAAVWKAILKRYPDQLRYLPDETLAKPAFTLELLNATGALPERVVPRLSPELRNDLNFIMKLIDQNWVLASTLCSSELRNNQEVALKALRHFDQDVTETVTWLGDVARDNPFVMSTAVLLCPAMMKFASERLRSEPDFVQDVLTASLALCEQAMQKDRARVGFSSAAAFDWRIARRENSRYRVANRKDIAHAVESILKEVHPVPRDHEKVMLLALLHDSAAVDYASARLKQSREFAQTVIETMRDQLPTAIAEDAIGEVLRDFGEPIRDDEELALLAITVCSGRGDMGIWSERLRSSRNFAMRAFNSALFRRSLLLALAPALRDDDELVMNALMTDGSAISAASDRLQRDRRFVIKAIQASQTTQNFDQTLQLVRSHYLDQLPPWAETQDERFFAATRCQIPICELNESLRADREVVLAALEAGASAKGVASSLLNDSKFAVEALRAFSRNSNYSPTRLRIGERLMSFFSDRLKDTEDVVLAAISELGTLAKFASQRLRTDAKFAAKAMSVSENAGTTIEFLAHHMRDNVDVMQAAARVNAELAVEFASERLRNDWQFAQTALTSSSNPDRLRSKFGKAIEEQELKALDASPPSLGMTAADWWAVMVVVIGASLLGYVFVAVPQFDKEFSSAMVMQTSIIGLLVIGFLFALNQVRTSRRSPTIRTDTSGITETLLKARHEAELAADAEEQQFRYTREGHREEVSPGGNASSAEMQPPRD